MSLQPIPFVNPRAPDPASFLAGAQLKEAA